MKSNPFYKKFTYFTIIILLISTAVQLWIPMIKISYVWPFILLFLYGFTLIAFTIVSKYINNKLTYFANAFMIVNFSKLLLFSIIIVVYALLNHDDAISFTGTFFIYYILLSAYEVVSLLKAQKK